MPIRVLVTGGTFDKNYDELTGRLFFRETHVPEMLRLGRARLDLVVETVTMIDSLEMDDECRAQIVERCRASEERGVVITHGTDTMIDTARAARGRAPRRQDRRADGRDGAVRVWQLRWALQSRERAVVRAGTAARRLHRDERPALRLGRLPEEPCDRRVRANNHLTSR